jgi:hypothetical protein
MGGARPRKERQVRKPACTPEELREELKKFYGQKQFAEKAQHIMAGNGPFSLRLLDFFVVNFCKHQDQRIHKSYKAQLEIYTKGMFDPFKRNERCEWDFGSHDVRLTTTLGQLCFLKWVLSTGIFEYVEANLTKISQAMKEHLSKKQGPSNKETEVRRHKLSRRRSALTVTATRARTAVGQKWIVNL